ncbi:hypothetical protein ASZ90_011332 [hydrocarbon metagenome]|uniref:Uncharacterized protein n=1 Tax=hydrocarbon metagenome TaxID=938273 RepID=A0A0W8FDL5_9ZZZZ
MFSASTTYNEYFHIDLFEPPLKKGLSCRGKGAQQMPGQGGAGMREAVRKMPRPGG